MTVDWTLLWPPLVASLLVLTTHVPLGRVVLARGIIFLDLAVAQIAALGVLVAELMHLEAVWMVQLCALLSALAGAMLLRWLERRWPDTQEATIGVSFVLAASAAMLLLSHEPHGGEHIKDLLSGQLLWVTPDQLWPVALVYAAMLMLWLKLRPGTSTLAFYLCFAVAVTLSVQLVGVYLVFASLILPALAVKRLPTRLALPIAFGLGALGYLLALLCSAWFDLPAGPVAVWSLALCALLVALLTGSQRFRKPSV